jgi:hypothetical protein
VDEVKTERQFLTRNKTAVTLVEVPGSGRIPEICTSAFKISAEVSNYFQITCADSDYSNSCWFNVCFMQANTGTVRKPNTK